MMRHHSNTGGKLIQNFLRVKVVEHGFFNLTMKGCRDIFEVVVLNKPRFALLFFGFTIQKLPFS